MLARSSIERMCAAARRQGLGAVALRRRLFSAGDDLNAPTRPIDPPIIADPVKRWGVVFGIYTFLTVFFVGQVVVRRVLYDQPIEWAGMIVFEALYWYVWAALTPIVLWFARRHRIKRETLGRGIGLHSAAAVAIGFLHSVGTFASTRLVFDANQSFGGKSFGVFLTHDVPAELFTGFYKYWLIVVIYYSIDYARKLRDREVEQAQLETRLAQAQLQALKMQLHPHFLFNTLHAISMLNFTDVDAANRVLVRLSDLLRLTLENSGAQEVRLRQELDFLRRYLEIEQTRFEDRLTVDIKADDVLLDALVPNLILQPLVENAIRHGVGRLARAGRLEVRAWRSENDLRLEVRDDGAGLPEGWDLDDNAGIGLANTRARLGQLYGDRHYFDISSPKEGGTVVSITIPLRFAGRTTEDHGGDSRTHR